MAEVSNISAAHATRLRDNIQSFCFFSVYLSFKNFNTMLKQNIFLSIVSYKRSDYLLFFEMQF